MFAWETAAMPRAHLDKAPHAVAAMFDAVARRYDITNDLLSLGMDRSWRRATVAAVGTAPGEMVLDLAAGTGTSSEPFHRGGARVVSCDFSVGMLRQGRRRERTWPFIGGDALRLPFAAATFDVVTISFGLRNIVDVPAALREMRRVTRPGGRLVICEFSLPTWQPWRGLYLWYLTVVLPRLARLVASDPEAYTYLRESIRAWPDRMHLARMIRDAGWGRVAFRGLGGGVVAIHRAQRPDID